MCALLSLAVNLIATGLIGYKGWCVPQSSDKQTSECDTIPNIEGI